MIPPAARCVRHHRSCSWHHAEIVRDYIDERRRQVEHAVEQSAGYDAEFAAFIEAHPLITFKMWLIGRRATR